MKLVHINLNEGILVDAINCTEQSVLNGLFENDVKMYGTQTVLPRFRLQIEFENDVKMYGTQTKNESYEEFVGLRMM